MKIKELREKVKQARKRVSKMKKAELLAELSAKAQLDSPQSALGNTIPTTDVKKMAKISANQQVNEPVEASVSTVEVVAPVAKKVRMGRDRSVKGAASEFAVAPQLVISGKSEDIHYGAEKKPRSKSRMTRHKKHHVGAANPADPTHHVEAVEEPKEAPKKAKAPKAESAPKAEGAPKAATAYRAFISEHTKGGKMTMSEAAKLWSSKKKA